MSNVVMIREQDPLKQGLKQKWREAPHKLDFIREQDPLKQGLKLFGIIDSCPFFEFVSKIH
mgnify:CR=1 FL=1